MPNEDKIQEWEQHRTNAKEKEFYSIQRFDILAISISAACIYIVFEILRFLKNPANMHSETCTVILKISAIASVFAIIINFLSQILGYHANKLEAEYSQEVINQLKGEITDDIKLNVIDVKSQIVGSLTMFLNVATTIFMLIGIILLVIYNVITF